MTMERRVLLFVHKESYETFKKKNNNILNKNNRLFSVNNFVIVTRIVSSKTFYCNFVLKKRIE